MRKVALTYVVITAIALLATVIVAVDARGGNLPEYVDVTFTSIADLDMRTDSVLAVCDTVKGAAVYKYMECHSLKCEELMVKNIAEWNGELAYVDGNCDSPEGCWIGYYIYYPAITCRHFAGREIWWMPERNSYSIIPSGKARIWYEERRK